MLIIFTHTHTHKSVYLSTLLARNNPLSNIVSDYTVL